MKMLCLYVRLHASNTSCTAERIYLEFIINEIYYK